MKILMTIASVILAIALWYALFKVAMGLAVTILLLPIVGVPIGVVAYMIYKLIFRK